MPDLDAEEDARSAAQHIQQTEDISAALADIRLHLTRQDQESAEFRAYMDRAKREEAEEQRLRNEQNQQALLDAAKEQAVREFEAKQEAKKLADRLMRQQRRARLANPTYTTATGLIVGTTLYLLNTADKGLLHLNAGQIALITGLYVAAIAMFIWAYRIAA